MEKKLQQVFWLLFFLLSHALQAQEWLELEALLPPYDSLSTGTAFGKSVAFNGSTAVVGAPAENNERGAAYVYEKIEGKWKKVARLLPVKTTIHDLESSLLFRTNISLFVQALLITKAKSMFLKNQLRVGQTCRTAL
jgi:hypothetical protein